MLVLSVEKFKNIYWLRSDLRVLDNETLNQCLKCSSQIIFVFAATKSLKKSDRFRRIFIEESFFELKRTLESKGFTVLKTDLHFSEFIIDFYKTNPFNSLYFTKEYAWDERQEEEVVKDFCQNNQVEIYSFDQGTLIAEKDLPFPLDKMPFIFSDFRRRVEENLKIRPLTQSSFTKIPDYGAQFSGGESKGLGRLKTYLWESNAIQQYKLTRNGLLHFNDSSKLSPWLNSGCLSPRTVYYELKKYELEVCQNESTYWLLFELLWRDYFKFFSLKFGNKIFLKEGVIKGKSANSSNLEIFKTWCEGKTQDPFINANMTELNQTGWMSNRGRQNVASYLIHDLGINWTWGASYFEEKLVDYDPDLNWGNWLYLSGRGSDPRARKFNTVKQAEMYDPDGEYQRKWRTY